MGIAGLLPVEDAALGALYMTIAAVLVCAPVAVCVVAGDRADRWRRKPRL